MQERPARIALISTELGMGGAERCLANIACRIDRLRFDPYVVSLAPRPVAPRDGLLDQLSDAGVPFEFLDIRSVLDMYRGLRRLKNRFIAEQTELVVSFLYHANVLTHRANRRATRCPHIMGIRVADPRRIRSLIERRAARSASRIVCVSRQVAEHCRSRGYPSERIDVIPNGVDLATAQSMTSPIAGASKAKRDPCVGFVGRLDRQKGADQLPEIARRVWMDVPGARFLIAGSGPSSNDLQTWSQTDEATGRVEILGWIDDPLEMMARCDCLIAPSRWEGMANVVMEAMSLGIPVVAYEVQGIDELLDGDLTRQSIAEADIATFADRTTELITDQVLANRLGIANRRRIETEFSLDRSIQQYERCFDSALRDANVDR